MQLSHRLVGVFAASADNKGGQAIIEWDDAWCHAEERVGIRANGVICDKYIDLYTGDAQQIAIFSDAGVRTLRPVLKFRFVTLSRLPSYAVHRLSLFSGPWQPNRPVPLRRPTTSRIRRLSPPRSPRTPPLTQQAKDKPRYERLAWHLTTYGKHRWARGSVGGGGGGCCKINDVD